MQRLFSEAVIVAGNSYTKETRIGPFRPGGIAVCEVVPEVGDINYRWHPSRGPCTVSHSAVRFMASFLFDAISGPLPVAFPCDNNGHRVMYDIDFTISVYSRGVGPRTSIGLHPAAVAKVYEPLMAEKPAFLLPTTSFQSRTINLLLLLFPPGATVWPLLFIYTRCLFSYRLFGIEVPRFLQVMSSTRFWDCPFFERNRVFVAWRVWDTLY